MGLEKVFLNSVFLYYKSPHFSKIMCWHRGRRRVELYCRDAFFSRYAMFVTLPPERWGGGGGRDGG